MNKHADTQAELSNLTDPFMRLGGWGWVAESVKELEIIESQEVVCV